MGESEMMARPFFRIFLQFSRRTVSNYLKRGSALGWCAYSIDKPHERHAKRMKK